MKGNYFTAMLQSGRVRVGPKESIEDIVTMYNIILNARGKDFKSASEFDEMLALTILCRIPFPGKRPRFKKAVSKIKNAYRGISQDEQLQENFRNIIGGTVIKAQSFQEIGLRKRSYVYRYQRSMRRTAQNIRDQRTRKSRG